MVSWLRAQVLEPGEPDYYFLPVWPSWLLNLSKPVSHVQQRDYIGLVITTVYFPLCHFLLHCPYSYQFSVVLRLDVAFVQVYEGKLADQYFQRTLLKKVWKGWRSVVQRQWKEVVERACQARAEEVCVHISNDYEAKLAVVSYFLSKNTAHRIK